MAFSVKYSIFFNFHSIPTPASVRGGPVDCIFHKRRAGLAPDDQTGYIGPEIYSKHIGSRSAMFRPFLVILCLFCIIWLMIN